MLSLALLIIHIGAGSVALLAAGVALFTAKGGVNHVRSGRVYALAMTGVFLTALPLALLGADLFLLLIGVFSFYLVFAGWRFARNRRGHPQPVDWAAVAIMGLTGLGMVGYGPFRRFSMGNYGYLWGPRPGVGFGGRALLPGRAGALCPAHFPPPDQYDGRHYRHHNRRAGGQRGHQPPVAGLDTADPGDYAADCLVEPAGGPAGAVALPYSVIQPGIEIPLFR